MSDQELFGNEEGTQTPPATPPADTNTPYDLLGSIKNADGTQKYKTQEDVAKGHDFAQSHIKTLEAEMATLKADNEAQREKISTQSTVDQLLKDALENKPPSAEETPPINGLNAQEVATLVDTALSSHKEKDAILTKAENNRNTVKSRLVEMYSDKASDKFKEVAENNNMTIQELTDMTETNPKVVLNLFSGANAAVEQSSPTSFSLPKDSVSSIPTGDNKMNLITGSVPRGAVQDSIRDITAEVKAKYGMT